MPGPVNVSLFGSDGTPGLLKRVLGPPADALGEALNRWVESRVKNVGRVLDNAERKLGDRALEKGEVSPRIAARLLDEGSYCDDDIMVEYLGGVLASARTPVGRDDRGARWVSLVTQMSTYAIRLHYVLYASAHHLYTTAALELNIADSNDLRTNQVAFDPMDLRASMDFEDGEDVWNIMTEALTELYTNGLISDWVLSSPEHFAKQTGKSGFESGGATFTPTTVGVQLWMWAQGMGATWRDWLTSELAISPDLVPRAAPHLLSGLMPAAER